MTLPADANLAATRPVSIQCPRCTVTATHFKTLTADISIFRCQGCGVAIYKNLTNGKTERILPGPKKN